MMTRKILDPILVQYINGLSLDESVKTLTDQQLSKLESIIWVEQRERELQRLRDAGL